MIRFSCPGCEATFNVADDKAGKSGKCPKCSSQFTIPDAPDGPAPAPPPLPAPVADGGAVEIAPCPKCGARLSVEAGDVGLDVECPTCRAVYPAEPAVAVRGRDPDAGSKSSASVGSGQKRKLVVAEDDDEEERPSRRRRGDEDRPSRASRRDEDDDQPRRKSRKRRRSAGLESKRVPAALFALFLGGFGAHKFYLGYTTPGLIMLLGTLLGYVGGCAGFFCLFTLPLFLLPCATGVVAFVEFIIYLSRSDEDFINMYQVNRQEWF